MQATREPGARTGEAGAVAVEYALMAVLIAVAIALSVTNLGQALVAIFQNGTLLGAL